MLGEGPLSGGWCRGENLGRLEVGAERDCLKKMGRGRWAEEVAKAGGAARVFGE